MHCIIIDPSSGDSEGLSHTGGGWQCGRSGSERGNVAATATSVFAGTIASGATRDWADRAATALTGQPTDARSTQAKLHDSLMNLLSNGIASAAGAAGGLVAGPGNVTANALNGASAASAIQQYNQALEKVLEKGLPRVRKVFQGLLD